MQDTSANNKRIVKNTFYLYIRMVVSLVISLYTSRVFLEALGVEDYGIYNIVGGFVALLAILTHSIRSAAQRFITYSLGKGDIRRLRNVFSTFVTLYIFVATAIFLLGEIVGLFFLDKILVLPENRISAAFFVYHCSLLSFVINLLTIPYNACVIAHEKMNFFAVVSIAESFFKLLMAYLLFVSPFDTLNTYAALFCTLNLLVLTTYWVYCKLSFIESKGPLLINRNIFKEIFSYSIWVIIGTSSAVVKEQGVNIMINNFWGVAMNAAKGVSVQVENVVNMFAANIGTAISPQITKSYAAGDTERAIRLTFFMAKVQGILLLYLCLPLITEANYILSLWLKEVPDHAVLFTQWVLILCVARTLDASVVPLHLAIGKQKYIQLVCGGTMLLNLPFSFFVLKMGLDPVATVVVGIVLEFLVLFMITIFLKRYISFPIFKFFTQSIFTVLFVGVVTITLLHIIIINVNFGLVRLLMVVTVSTLLISIIAFLIALNKNERALVLDMVKKRLNKEKN